MRIPIAKRLAAMFAVAALVVFFCSAVALRHALEVALERQQSEELEIRQAVLEHMIYRRANAADWALVHEKLGAVAPADGSARYWVFSDDPRFRYGDMADAARWLAAPDGFGRLELDGRAMKTRLRTIPANGERPAVRFMAGLDGAPFAQTLQRFTIGLVVISAVAMLLVALLGYWVSRIGLRPVSRLSAEANTLSPSNLAQRLGDRALPPELADLVVSFNGALARVESAYRQLEGFNADVAHELRTPLTNLIGQTQVALARDRDKAEFEDVLQSNLEELERLRSIVNDMLFLTKADRGCRATELVDVSLREEAEKTLEYLDPVLEEERLRVEIVGDARARIEKRLFHRALANLIQNAAQHAPPDTVIAVAIEPGEDRCRVSVANCGTPIERRHLERLFERFYRADLARSNSDEHHGLGLAIVRAIALMHGGEVFADSGEGLNTFGFTMVG